jgi:hypothetical protein
VERGRFFHLTRPLRLVYTPVCATRASGHSGQPPSGDPPFTRRPERIPNEVLRDFVREQARLRTYRALAEAWGLGHETLRKFATGRTRQPHPRQLELYGTKFLELHPSGYVREKRVDGRARALEQLKMVLPPGRENAQQILDRVFELAARHPDELPDAALRMQEWLHKLLNAEYDAEVRYELRRSGARRETE